MRRLKVPLPINYSAVCLDQLYLNALLKIWLSKNGSLINYIIQWVVEEVSENVTMLYICRICDIYAATQNQINYYWVKNFSGISGKFENNEN